MLYEPHDYQREGARQLLSNPKFGLLYDPGLGKTATVLHAIKALTLAKPNFKALIIAPRLVCLNTWPEEITKWNQFRHIKHVQIRDEKTLDFDRSEHIWLINPEISRLEKLFNELVSYLGFGPLEKWLKSSYLQKSLYQTVLENPEQWPFDMLILDESSKFKNPSSKRFKLLKKFLPYFQRRAILTGTFAPNGLQDIFAQQYIIDNGETFGRTVTGFRNKYFVLDNPKFYTYRIKGEQAVQEIQQKVAPWVMRLDANDHLDLPELVHNIIQIPLSKNRQAHYDGIEKQFFTELQEEKSLIAKTASMKYLLCRQMANGAYYDPERDDPNDKEVFPFHPEKTDALKNLIDELNNKPLLIAYVFQSDAYIIQRDLHRIIATISGKTPEKKTQEIVKGWNDRRVPLLLAQCSTISHGLNLQAGGNDLCFFSLTDNLEDYEQLVRRIYRQGVKGQVRIHYLVMRNTVDEIILARIRRKEKTERDFLTALEQYRRNKYDLGS